MPMGPSGRILQFVRAESIGFVEIGFASVQSLPASATLAVPRLEAILVALFVEPVAEFLVVDLHAILVIFGSRGTGPANELGDTPKLVGKEAADRCS